MKNRDSFMTPISSLFMLIAITPYIGIRFGNLPLLLLSPLILYSVFNAYQFYKNRASEKNISYAKALKEDLPYMSPIHFIFLIITSRDIKNFIGVVVAWVLYTVYYYGFREKQ